MRILFVFSSELSCFRSWSADRAGLLITGVGRSWMEWRYIILLFAKITSNSHST